MSRGRRPLQVNITIDNSDGFNSVSGSQRNNLQRDAGLAFDLTRDSDRNKEAFIVQGMAGKGNLYPSSERYKAKIPLERTELFVKVEKCRKAWQQAVVDAWEIVEYKRRFPFQSEWNLQKRPELLSKAAPTLASEGYRLFKGIFQHEDPALDEIANRLERASRDRSLVLTIHSEEFFIPWGMIYTPPDGEDLKVDGSNWKPEGFWGSRHILEHNTGRHGLRPDIRPKAGQVRVGLNVDDKLDEELKAPVVSSVISFFEGMPTIKPLIRKTKADLRTALNDAQYADQIVYFCCHGVVSGTTNAPNFGEASIALSDRPQEEVSVDDIHDWLSNRTLDSTPLIFMNSCQGGQMASLFYKSFAAEFLDKRANCVVGPQTDVPGVFAAEYAKQFFTRFFGGNRRVGMIVRDLAWEFLDTYKNPLGLIYSLYRGVDTYFDPSGS